MICPAGNAIKGKHERNAYGVCQLCGDTVMGRYAGRDRSTPPDPRDEELARYKAALERIANREGATMRWPIIAREALKLRTEK